MKSFACKLLASCALVASGFAFAQADKVVMGVSIPAATHGWTGGVVYWANQTKTALEKQYPGIKVIVKTAGSTAEQAKRTDIKIVFGGAGAKGMIKTLMDGKDPRIQANVSYSPKFIYDAIKLTAEARLKGEKLPPTYIIPSVLITRDNASKFYFPDSPF